MIQHPVGQGGLFRGELTLGSKPLRWVYDCGSNQTDALARETTSVAADGDIDLLFLSHLDSDHVCGVDLLLSKVNVREVVLPYLSEITLIAIMARDISRGALTGTFIEAVNDLAGWFGSRGVDTVTFVRGRREDDEGEGGPRLPGEPSGEGGREGDVSAKWTTPPTTTPSELGQTEQVQMPRQGRARVQTVDYDAALQIHALGAVLNWVLIPHVYEPPAERLQAFENALIAVFGTPLNKRSIARASKEPQARQVLRKCYDALWGDHNLVSMTLYCGPWHSPDIGDLFVSAGLGGSFSGTGQPYGWMLTGDAHLERQRRRECFLGCYEDYLQYVNVLMLPHHGARNNHSNAVLASTPNLLIGYAAAGPNSYVHPHPDVVSIVGKHARLGFHQVSDDAYRMLLVHFRTR